MKPVRLLSRAVSVLKSFTPSEPELTASEIARKVGIPKTSAQRLLASLSDGGLLEKSAETNKYKVGAEIYMLGSLYLSTTDFLKAAEPVVMTLNDLTDEAVTVSILDKGYVTLVMREESKYGFRWAYHIGSIQPAYAAATGKALLSELTEEELDSIYPEESLRPITKKTIATKKELKLELKRVREIGVAFTSEELFEQIEGVACVIRDASGRAVAGMSIAVPVFRMDDHKRQRLARLVKLGCNLASYRLGFQDKTNPVHSIEEIRSWWEQNEVKSAL